MPRHGHLRHGSLQFYPRVRAKKILPGVRWSSIKDDKKESGLVGFIGYKVGMKSAYVRDNTPNSQTKGQRVTLPVTVIECPPLKVLSVRFYMNNKVMGEVLNSNVEASLKRKLKVPKKINKKIEDFKEFEDIRMIVYSQVKKTGIKKTPDITELGLSGTKEEKLNFVKNNMQKEIALSDFIKEGVVDVRGVTKGKGTQGTTKRFGLSLKAHKSEKGRRTLGSGGPWNPSRVDFIQPMAGQMGYFTRIVYNSRIVHTGKTAESDINPKEGFKNFGKIKTDYLILQGSIQGPSKRQVLITIASRPTNSQIKKNYEFIELR